MPVLLGSAIKVRSQKTIPEKFQVIPCVSVSASDPKETFATSDGPYPGAVMRILQFVFATAIELAKCMKAVNYNCHMRRLTSSRDV